MLKKIIKTITITLFFYIIILLAYQTLFVYTVFPGDEAIVVRFGKIVGGPKTPGYHRRIPIIDKIHHIKIAALRKQTISIRQHGNYHLNAIWKVSDPIKFYLSSVQYDIPVKIEESMLNATDYIISDITSEELDLICRNKERNCKYKNKYLADITHYIQEDTIRFGIQISRVDIVKL